MVNSKKKGNAWENKIATVVRNHFVPQDYDAKTAHSLVHRTPMSGGHVEKGDLIIKPPIWKHFPWFIECRNRESWSWKNVMEKGEGSVIGKWFLEDAIDKCHPYDNDAVYARYPLLLFTKNHQKVYFCADIEDLDVVIGNWEFNPYVLIDSWIIGSFDAFLYFHGKPGIKEDINKYLGIHDVFGDGQ
jgi:hypothetical protein